MSFFARLFRRSESRAPSRRSFDAAGQSGRWPVSSILNAPVAQSLAAAGVMARRADWLVSNSAIAASFLSVWTEHLVGAGPTLRAGHPDAETRRLVEARWYAFSRRCDAEGAGDLAGVLAKAVRSLVTHGEAFIQLAAIDRRLRLRVISPEQVARDWTRTLENGNRVLSGVELDGDGRRAGYWVHAEQADFPFAATAAPERISADDLLHCFDAKFPGAVRGTSWLAPVATSVLELDRLNDAILARANVAALFAGFVRDLSGASGFADDAALGAGGRPELSMEPGTMRILPAGTDVTFTPSPDNDGASEFVAHLMRSIAAGGGVPAFLLSGDLSSVNYSSARIGLEAFKRSVARIQQSLLVAQLLQPIFERWLAIEILSGRLAAPDFERDPEAWLAVEFRWAAWAPLDPLKEAAADEIALRNHVKSRAEIIAARGRDIEDVAVEFEHDPFPPPDKSGAHLHISEKPDA